MNLQYTYDFHMSLYDNIETYAKNRQYWLEEDKELYSKLGITGGPRVGPERKKWKYFTDHIKLKRFKI